jgi:outer membrane protein insertion porin family
MLLPGCMTTRFLQNDEHLLGKQQIKGTQKVSKQVLAQYCQQQPNRKWLGVPFLLWMYQTGQCFFDEAVIQEHIAQIEAKFETEIAAAADNECRVQRLQQKRDKKLNKRKKILQEGNLLMRYGEPPVIYDPQQSVATEHRLLDYLHTKGYFKAQVSSSVKLCDQKATMIYQIEENKPYMLGVLRLNTSDKAIEKLLQDHRPQSLLKRGDCYDQEVLYQERERIDDLLSNHGYFSFEKRYIRFDVDNTAVDNAVIVETVIDTPIDSQAHPVFHIDQVVWDVGVTQAEEVIQEQGTCDNGIIFKNLQHQFKSSVLANKLSLHPKQLYRKKDQIETYRRLSRLDMFKNIHIDIAHDVLDNSKLVSHIHTTPADRFQLVNELGLQVSRSHWLPKPFYELSLKGRNLCKRLEIWELVNQVGVEGVVAATTKKDFASSQAYGVGLMLACSWQQFLLPLTPKTHNYLERLDPMTKISLGYKFTRHPDYTQDTFTSFVRYDWKGQGRGAYEFTPLRIDLTNTRRIEDAFQSHLKALQLYKTFEPSWLTLLSFRSTFCTQPVYDTDSSYVLDFFCESGGTLQNFIDLRKVMPQLTHYQYIKLDIGYSQRIPIRLGTVFAYCIKTGIGYAYGREKVLPYSRYYFLGYSNCMRAWLPQSLGPGSYSPPQEAGAKRSLEQLGDFLLQGSVELRQQLVGFLEGALFVDAGNIWALHDNVRQGGEFSGQNFYKEIAVGTGVGFRFNFKFFVLRLDAGLKLYDPARPSGERFVGDQLFMNKPVFSLGIDYPF